MASGERTPSPEPSVTPRASPKEKSSRSQPSVAIKVAPVDAMVVVATSASKQPPETSVVATACRCRKPYQRALHAVSIPAQLNMHSALRRPGAPARNAWRTEHIRVNESGAFALSKWVVVP